MAVDTTAETAWPVSVDNAELCQAGIGCEHMLDSEQRTCLLRDVDGELQFRLGAHGVADALGLVRRQHVRGAGACITVGGRELPRDAPCPCAQGTILKPSRHWKPLLERTASMEETAFEIENNKLDAHRCRCRGRGF